MKIRLILTLFATTVSMGFVACLYAAGGNDSATCSELNGKAFGLCNAYCEAMDCDEAEPNASETACQNQYSAFMEVTGVEPPCLGDEPPPVAATCPCAEEWWQLDLFPSEPTTYEGCGSMDDQDNKWIMLQIGHYDTEPYRQLIASSHIVESDTLEYAMECVSYSGPGGRSSDDLDGGVVFYNAYPNRPTVYSQLEEALYTACHQEILDLAEHLGVECTLDN